MADSLNRSTEGSPRAQLLQRALLLVTISVAWGAFSGAFSVAVGLLDRSLAVLGVGLNVLADLAGSAILIWRFCAERRHPINARRVEARAAIVVAGALCVVSIVLSVAALHALVVGSAPGTSPLALVAAAVTLVVLTPLALAKRRVGSALRSRALMGDGTLSAIGASTAFLALVGLLLYHSFGWWWADRVAALVVAAIAGLEAYRAARGEE